MADRELATILLVEDEPADATLMGRAFERAKVLNPIVHIKNGDDALAYLAGVAKYVNRIEYPLPALILLDLKMPGMTGLQLLQWMRTNRDVRRIPVVVLTGDDSPATVSAAYELGANSYLVKPGNPNEIARLVDTIQRYWIELNQAPPLVMQAAEK
jgi:CheY-like chemotaxis protein